MLDALTLAVALALFHAWIGYPLLLEALTRRRRRALDRPALPSDAALPRMAVLLSAYNEERHIGARLANLASLDYPRDRLSIYVGVDGATDATGARARAAASGLPHVQVHAFPENRGKVAVLKDLVRLSDDGGAEVLTLTDANTDFAPDALKMLAARLADPAVGGVCGRLVFVDHSGCETHENAYWRWENRMKLAESLLDSCLGANGAIYAIRRGCFWPEIPENTVVDDFVIGMKVRERGARMVYEPAAVAREELPATVGDEWVRRVRIGAGGFQALGLCRRCLARRHGWFAWMFFSHKVLRWFTPHLLLALGAAAAAGLAAAAAGVGLPWVCPVARGLAAAAGAAVCLGLLMAAAIGRFAPIRAGGWWTPFRGAAYFVAMQTALLAGFVRYCRGGLRGNWQRTRRHSPRTA